MLLPSQALKIESKWCILPSWLRVYLLLHGQNSSILPFKTRFYVFFANYAHLFLHRMISTNLYLHEKLISHPKYFSTLLENSTHSSYTRRIVLLHGWKMSHKDWKQTALKLHRKNGYSILLVDFFGHGYSPHLPTYDSHLPELYVHQVRDAIIRAKWHLNPSIRITFAGISLGCAVSLRYAQLYPTNVENIIMLCGAGTPVNRWYALTPWLNRIVNPIFDGMNRFCHQNPSIHYWLNHFHPIHQFLSHSHLCRYTPEHGVDPNSIETILNRFATTVIWSQFDYLHPLQLEIFPRQLHVRIIPYCEHAIFCSLVDFFQLDQEIEIWKMK